MIVIGVRSSWPASETNSRWLENAASRRSSIALNVRAELGDLVVALDLDALREVGSVIARAPCPEPAQRRQHPPGGHEADHRHEQQHGERDAGGDLDRLGDVGGVLADRRCDGEHALGLAAGADRHGDVAHAALGGVELAALDGR